jgi:transposase
MLQVIDCLESSLDNVVYALDETGVRIESDNHSSWSPVGIPPVLEKNGSRKGINIIGSTSILNNFHTVNDVYSSRHSITSKEVITHLKYLIEINRGKKVVVFLDNAKIHTSKAIKGFYLDNRDILSLIFMPRYSPNMNPQENIWNYLKAKLFRPTARGFIEELILDAKYIYDELNSNADKIRSLAYARSFLV